MDDREKSEERLDKLIAADQEHAAKQAVRAAQRNVIRELTNDRPNQGVIMSNLDYIDEHCGSSGYFDKDQLTQDSISAALDQQKGSDKPGKQEVIDAVGARLKNLIATENMHDRERHAARRRSARLFTDPDGKGQGPSRSR